MLHLFLWVFSHCFCYYIHTWWPAPGNVPLCLSIKLKWLCFSHRATIWPRPPVYSQVFTATEKKKLIHPLPDAGQARQYFAILIAILFYLLISSSFLFYKRNWHPDPNKMVSRGTLVLHLLGLPAFQIQLCFLPQHFTSWFTGLLCSQQSKLGSGDFTVHQARELVFSNRGAAVLHRAAEDEPGPGRQTLKSGEAHLLKPATLARHQSNHLCELFYDRRSW